MRPRWPEQKGHGGRTSHVLVKERNYLGHSTSVQSMSLGWKLCPLPHAFPRHSPCCRCQDAGSACLYLMPQNPPIRGAPLVHGPLLDFLPREPRQSLGGHRQGCWLCAGQGQTLMRPLNTSFFLSEGQHPAELSTLFLWLPLEQAGDGL